MASHRLELCPGAADAGVIGRIGELRDDDRGQNAENHDDNEDFDEGEAASGTSNVRGHGLNTPFRGLIRPTHAAVGTLRAISMGYAFTIGPPSPLIQASWRVRVNPNGHRVATTPPSRTT